MTKGLLQSVPATSMKLESTVDRTESLGCDRYVYFTLEGASASVAESAPQAGQAHRIWLPLERIHLFAPSTGRNLTLNEQIAAD